jgi:MFS family permease
MFMTAVGALALSAETIIGALIPVFALEYAGIDPKILSQVDVSALSPPGVVNLNPLKLLAGLGGPPLWKISLLASLPLLTNGISSYFLVPLSIAVGRRPVLLACGVMAWSGGFWAAMSRSLDSHIAARCVQAVGAGAVEALIPLMIQDLVFIHQRNRAMSFVWSTQVPIPCSRVCSLLTTRTGSYNRELGNRFPSHCRGHWLALFILHHVRVGSRGLACARRISP